MIPIKDNIGDPVSWRYTDQVRNGDVFYRGADDEEEEEMIIKTEGIAAEMGPDATLYRLMRVFIHKPENVTLGCSIYCGTDSK